MKDKKIAMVFGKGLDGCGVQRGGVEMQMWARANGLCFDIYSYDERKFGRANGHEMDSHTSFMEDTVAQTREQLEKYDIVIFNSYPSPKHSNSSIIAFYEGIVKALKNPIKVGMMHELNKTNIDKIPYLMGIMNECDVLYNFTEKSWFSQTISRLLPSKTLSKRMNKFTMWFNFDEFDKSRNEIPFAEKKRELLYCSRWTTSKVPRRVLDIGPYLKGTGIAGKVMGIERSIGAKADIFDHPNCLDCTGKERVGPVDGVEVYGPYVRRDGLNALQQSLFGCSFYRLPKDPDGYGDRMEYAQIEIIAAGAIPVFDKHWSENNYTIDGRKYSDIPFSGIYIDGPEEDKLKAAVEKIVEVEKDETLQQKYFDTSYSIIKEEFDVNKVLPRMFEHILKVGKDSDKFKTDAELILALTNEPEFVELYHEYNNKKEVVVLGIRELTENIFCIIDGKKEKEIKKWKKAKSPKVIEEEQVNDDFFSF